MVTKLQPFILSIAIGTIISPLFLLHSSEAQAIVSKTDSTISSPVSISPDALDRQRRIAAARMELHNTLCLSGKGQHCTPPMAKNVDLAKLAHAVAIAETSDKGMILAKNNYHGITKKGGGFRSFASKEESYLAFQRLWITKYGDHFPTLSDAKKYSGSEGTHWLATVTVAYNRQ